MDSLLMGPFTSFFSWVPASQDPGRADRGVAAGKPSQVMTASEPVLAGLGWPHT